MPSRSLRIVNEVVSILKTINGTGAFYNDVGGRVYKGRMSFDATDDYPILSVNASGDRKTDASTGAFNKHKLSKFVEVHGIVKITDINNPMDDAELLVADIKRAIFNGDERLNGNCITVEYTEALIGQVDTSVNMISCQVNLSVVYAEHLNNPDL